MKKFNFSLEKVLQIKEMEEKIIQKKLFMVQNSIYLAEQEIIAFHENIDQERENITQLINTRSSSSDVMLHYNYLEGMEFQIEILVSEIEKLKMTEIEIKNELIEKSKEKKALEKLKEIQYEDYRRGYKKEQLTIIDEISIQSFRNKRASNYE